MKMKNEKIKLTTGLNVYCFVSSTHYTCTVIDMKLNKKKKKNMDTSISNYVCCKVGYRAKPGICEKIQWYKAGAVL